MARSIGLTAYRALSKRSTERAYKPRGKRPRGTLVWIHAGEPENMLAVQDLAQRLCNTRFGVHVLITLPDPASYEQTLHSWVPHDLIQIEQIPSEHPHAITSFWRYWMPEVAIWAWGDLRPNLVDKVHAAGCPIALIDADEAGFDGKRDRWLPELSRQLLEPFVAIMVRSNAAVQKLQALGVETARIDKKPPLQAGGNALACREADLTDLTETLRGRPVWLANNVQEEELPIILQAHRQSLRLSHRLLLVLHPAHGGLSEVFAEKIVADGLRKADWTLGEEPDDASQVLLTEDHGDLGLFYRLAPVTFMGSSLVAGYSGRNPFEAAALGSAVLYGPNVRRFMPFYSRLAKAGAARIVKDGETLGAAVTQLIAPDQAAAMAHAGWDVVSEGADLTDRVIDLVQAALDGELETTHARS